MSYTSILPICKTFHIFGRSTELIDSYMPDYHNQIFLVLPQFIGVPEKHNRKERLVLCEAEIGTS